MHTFWQCHRGITVFANSIACGSIVNIHLFSCWLTKPRTPTHRRLHATACGNSVSSSSLGLTYGLQTRGFPSLTCTRFGFFLPHQRAAAKDKRSRRIVTEFCGTLSHSGMDGREKNHAGSKFNGSFLRKSQDCQLSFPLAP